MAARRNGEDRYRDYEGIGLRRTAKTLHPRDQEDYFTAMEMRSAYQIKRTIKWTNGIDSDSHLARNKTRKSGITNKGIIPKRATSPRGRGYPLRQNQILPRFRGRDVKQFLNFTLPPTGGLTTAAYLSGPAPADAR